MKPVGVFPGGVRALMLLVGCQEGLPVCKKPSPDIHEGSFFVRTGQCWSNCREEFGKSKTEWGQVIKI